MPPPAPTPRSVQPPLAHRTCTPCAAPRAAVAHLLHASPPPRNAHPQSPRAKPRRAHPPRGRQRERGCPAQPGARQRYRTAQRSSGDPPALLDPPGTGDPPGSLDPLRLWGHSLLLGTPLHWDLSESWGPPCIPGDPPQLWGSLDSWDPPPQHWGCSLLLGNPSAPGTPFVPGYPLKLWIHRCFSLHPPGTGGTPGFGRPPISWPPFGIWDPSRLPGTSRGTPGDGSALREGDRRGVSAAPAWRCPQRGGVEPRGGRSPRPHIGDATRGHRGRFVSAADNSGGARERAAARGRGIATPHRTAPHRTAPRWGRRGDIAETPPGLPRPPRNPRSPQPRHVPAPGHGHRRWHTRGVEVGVCPQVGAARGGGRGGVPRFGDPLRRGRPPVPRYPLALGIPPALPEMCEPSGTTPAPWGAQGAFWFLGTPPSSRGCAALGTPPRRGDSPGDPPAEGNPPLLGIPRLPGTGSSGGCSGLALIGGEGAATLWGAVPRTLRRQALWIGGSAARSAPPLSLTLCIPELR